MSEAMDPAVLDFYARLPQQGPGSDADAEAALRGIFDRLPPNPVVADFGCGTGRSTLFLAERLNSRVIAVEFDAGFCGRLAEDARARNLAGMIDVRQCDMSDPPVAVSSLDLLWCEGAAYIIGFSRALGLWRPLLRPGAFCVVSECAWLSDERPEAVVRFFAQGYPEMTTLAGNAARAREQGYDVLATHVFSKEAWDRYYGPVRQALAQGEADRIDRAFADELGEEIAVHDGAAGSYGYVFFVLEKSG